MGATEILKKTTLHTKIARFDVANYNLLEVLTLCKRVHYIMFFFRQYIRGHDHFFLHIYLNLKLWNKKSVINCIVIYISPNLAKQ